MTDRHEFTLRIPSFLFKILEEYKMKTGISINAQISQSIVKNLFLEGLVTLADFRDEPVKQKTVPVKKAEPMPEALKFCDGAHCEVPLNEAGC